MATSIATEAGQKLAEVTGDAFAAAKDLAVQISQDARDHVKAGVSVMHDKVDAIAAQVGGATADVVETVRRSGADAAGVVASETIGRAGSVAADAFSDGEVRDRILLGVAGVAVATALGIAYQKRLSAEA